MNAIADDRNHAVSRPARRVMPVDAAPTPRLVLLVDDHQDTREMYAYALLAAGYQVVEATDGVDAIVTASGNLPDVVITDMRMPGPITAADLCRHFRPQGVHVIVVTGVAPGQEHEAVQAAGCALIAAKPFPPDVLCAEVSRIVQRTPLEQRPSR